MPTNNATMSKQRIQEIRERIANGLREMQAEKATYHTWEEGKGIKITQYQGPLNPRARGEQTDNMSALQRAANYRVKGGKSKLDVSIAELYRAK